MGRAITYVVVFLVFMAIAAGCNYAVGSMADQQTAISAMQSAGYTEVQVIGRQNIFVSLLGCSSEDSTKFDMMGTNPQGIVVTNAYVCVGWPFKGATIRYK